MAAVQEGNILYLKSRVMEDVPEGGGGPSRHVIPHGELYNVFPSIAELDREYGRFRLRQLFVGIRTATREALYGARTFLTELPSDPAVSYSLFAFGQPMARRSDASGRVAA